jgi:endonuclease/exonuclease/phosphatase family metal-dependent hydrolase
MKKLLLVCFAISFGITTWGQDLDIPPFGTDSTFEVMTWNIEWFPTNGQTTVDYVREIIQDLDVDLIAMQELDDTIVFKQMMNELENYEGYFKSSWFAGLAFIYNSAIIEVDTIYEIYTTEPYWRPFPRSPMVMELNYSGQEYVVINNHFKCCGDGVLDMNDSYDEETRRLDASNLLKAYMDDYFFNKRVIMTGDLNDLLVEDNPYNNVFKAFINDPENYLFADMEIAEGGEYYWSYPSWPSHLDHILINKPLFHDFENESSQIETIRIDDYFDSFYQYEINVSDHRPVAIKIHPDFEVGTIEKQISTLSLSNYPNPFYKETTFSIGQRPGKCTLEIYNSRGIKVDQCQVEAFQNSFTWVPENLPGGFYYARIRTGGKTGESRKLLLLK